MTICLFLAVGMLAGGLEDGQCPCLHRWKARWAGQQWAGETRGTVLSAAGLQHPAHPQASEKVWVGLISVDRGTGHLATEQMVLNSCLVLTCEITSQIGLIRTFRGNGKTGLNEHSASLRELSWTQTKPLTRESPDPQTWARVWPAHPSGSLS